MPAVLQSTSDDLQSVSLDKPILLIGRHPDCDLVIKNSRKVSRKHCCIVEIDGTFMVRDLGSTNGIQINSRRVTGLKTLQAGDNLTIGDCEFIFKPAQYAQQPKQVVPKVKKDDSDDEDSPYSFDLEDIKILPDVPDHELSSDIPILLDDPVDDGFDIGAAPFNPARSKPRKRNRSDSDSQVELIAD